MDEENLVNVVTAWVTNGEVQAIFLIGCTCVGAWVLFKLIMQMVFHGVKSWYSSTQRQLIFWCVFAFMYCVGLVICEMVFSVLWPFFMVIAVLICMPTWRKMMVKEIVPKHLETIKRFGHKLAFNHTAKR